MSSAEQLCTKLVIEPNSTFNCLLLASCRSDFVLCGGHPVIEYTDEWLSKTVEAAGTCVVHFAIGSDVRVARCMKKTSLFPDFHFHSV